MRIRGAFGEYWASDTPWASGSSAQVFRCSPLNHVYKRYRTPVTDPAEMIRLRQLRDLGRRVLFDAGQAVGSTPEASINWAVDLVDGPHGATITGVILPEIPSRFLLHGTTRSLDGLIIDRADPPPARVRLAVLLRLAEMLDYLDTEGLVHGDIAPRTVLWCETPEPGAYLLGSDGLRPQEPPPRIGPTTPGWRDPRLAEGLIPAHDRYSDHYALALALYRGLLLRPGALGRTSDGTWATPTAYPSVLPPVVRELFERSLGSPLDATGRAAPREWVRVLTDSDATADRFDAEALRALDDDVDRQRARTGRPRRRVSHPEPTPAAPRRLLERMPAGVVVGAIMGTPFAWFFAADYLGLPMWLAFVIALVLTRGVMYAFFGPDAP